jgi:putative transposase
VKRREAREQKKKEKKALIKKIFEGSGDTYGPDRICGVLRREGNKASYDKVKANMEEMGLKSIHCRKKRQRSLTDSRKSRGEGYPNLVRGMANHKQYQAVCSDITYLKSGEGWLYYCIVKDIATGEILGEAYSPRMTKQLVIRAFMNAQARHCLPAGTIFHSDRGSQYTSKTFKKILEMYGIKQSFSRVGMPGDNAWAESFFATLKKECIHFNHFATRDELQQTVFTWTNSFYNTRRVQARLGYLSPKEYGEQCVVNGKRQVA